MNRDFQVDPTTNLNALTGGLRICVLGVFHLSIDGQEVATSVAKRTHARRLIQLLSTSLHLRCSRSSALQALWPDSDFTLAANRLHHTIHLIRKAFAELPDAYRPMLGIHDEEIFLRMPAMGRIDFQIFQMHFEGDETSDEQRRSSLELALADCAGVLAPDWLENEEINSRRAWHEESLAKARKEVAVTCAEAGQVDLAMRHACELLMQAHATVQDHVEVALAIAAAGDPQAALRHCNLLLEQLDTDEVSERVSINQAITGIQRSSNQRAAIIDVSLAGVRTGRLTRLSLPKPLPLTPAIEAAAAEVKGLLFDLGTSIVTITGGPGAGKASLAITVASRLQGQTIHGAVLLDCQDISDADDLKDRVGAELADLTVTGDLQPSSCLAEKLRATELILVLTHFRPTAELTQALMELTRAGHDNRWLVSTWGPLRTRGERVVSLPDPLPGNAHFDYPSPFLQDGLSPMGATELIDTAPAFPLPLEDRGIIESNWWLTDYFEQARKALGSGKAQYFEQAPTKVRISWLLEHLPNHVFWERTEAWMAVAPTATRQMFSRLAPVKSWLTRRDIKSLCADLFGEQRDLPGIECAIDFAAEHHFLIRRIKEGRDFTQSVYSLHPICRLVCCCKHQPSKEVTEHRARWLLEGLQTPEWAGQFDPAETEVTHLRARAQWFDDRIEDMTELFNDPVLFSAMVDFRSLAAAEMGAWLRFSRFQHLVRRWMTDLDVDLARMPAPTRAKVLINRASLHAVCGQPQEARQDAARFLRMQGAQIDTALHGLATDLLTACSPWKASVDQTSASMWRESFDTAQQLICVSRIAMLRGNFVGSERACQQALQLAERTNDAVCLAHANIQLTRLAYATGNEPAAIRALDLAHASNTVLGDIHLGNQLLLLAAQWDLTTMRFERVEQGIKQLLHHSRALTETQHLRAILLLGWSQLAQGLPALAQALGSETKARSRARTSVTNWANAELLLGLSALHQGRKTVALEHLNQLSEIMSCRSVELDRQDLKIGLSELASGLQVDSLLHQSLKALASLNKEPELRMRPWVRFRYERVLRSPK